MKLTLKFEEIRNALPFSEFKRSLDLVCIFSRQMDKNWQLFYLVKLHAATTKASKEPLVLINERPPPVSPRCDFWSVSILWICAEYSFRTLRLALIVPNRGTTCLVWSRFLLLTKGGVPAAFGEKKVAKQDHHAYKISFIVGLKFFLVVLLFFH